MSDAGDIWQGVVPEPADPSAPGSPLDFLAEEHVRIRDICVLIGRIAEHTGPHPEIIARVSHFLRSELPFLIADEEDGLLPLMQRRCLPEDEIDRLRARLDAEHDTALYLLPDALGVLDALAAGTGVGEAETNLLRNFATHLHRHLIFENGILIPLARARLSGDDLEALRLRIRDHRGRVSTDEGSDDG